MVQPVKIADLRSVEDDQTVRPLLNASSIHADEPQRDSRPVSRLASLPEPVVISPDHPASSAAEIRAVGYDQHIDQPIHAHSPGESVQACSCESCHGGAIFTPLEVVNDPMFDLACDAASCDSGYCDSVGCDSMGCGGCGHLGLSPETLFGSIDLLLMFRKGDGVPPLASNAALNVNGVQVFAGGETILKDMTAGGRLVIGAWLDRYKDRSFVARGWFAGEESYGYSANQNTQPVLGRPFLNVTDGQVPADDIRIIASPGRAGGELNINADNNVYGADFSIRQLWYKRFGGTVDLLYGYQYMRMDDSMRIGSRATSLNDDFAPVGAVIAVSDEFAAENEFHGGQLGIASHYREGAWSFSSLAKLGFGSIRRRSVLTGSTFTSIDGNNATDPNGLLVRSTNSGTRNDDTFGWVPELDLTLGWQRYPSFDLTFGYHVIAMTDALQVSGMIDPNLATNLASPPTGAQRPSPTFRHGTFYVQGIHFGLAYVY
jgi:hypothetical protein